MTWCNDLPKFYLMNEVQFCKRKLRGNARPYISRKTAFSCASDFFVFSSKDNDLNIFQVFDKINVHTPEKKSLLINFSEN